MGLQEQLHDLSLKQGEQDQLLESSAEDLASIRKKLKVYRDTT